MKNLLLCLIISIPISLLGQKKKNDPCRDMLRKARYYTNRNSLAEAFTEYISALNCDDKLGVEIAPELKKVYDKILDEKKRSENLLDLFFEEKNGSKQPVAWVQEKGQNAKYAVIKREDGKRITSYEWEAPQRFDNGTAIAKKGGQYYFLTVERGEKGKDTVEVSKAGYDYIHRTTNQHMYGIRVMVDSQAVDFVVDKKTGAPLNGISLRRKGFQKPASKVFPYEKNGKWGLMHENGAIPLGPTYESILPLREGYTGASIEGKWRFIDEDGRPQHAWGSDFDEVGEFIDSIAWVRKGNRFGILTIGRDETPELHAKSLNEAIAIYFKDFIHNGLWKSVPQQADIAESPPFDRQIKPIGEGISIQEILGERAGVEYFRMTSKEQIIGKDREVISESYDKIIPLDLNSQMKDNLIYLKDRIHIFKTLRGSKKGLLIFEKNEPKRSAISAAPTAEMKIVRFLEPEWEDIGVYQIDEDYIRVKKNGKWGFIFWQKQDQGQGMKNNNSIPSMRRNDKQTRIPCQYDIVTDFFERKSISKEEKVARVFLSDYKLYFYINKNGEMLADISQREW